MDAESYLVIRDIRVNFNNSSGLLSTFTQQQLYDASLSSGLKDLTWEQFTGCTIAPATSLADNDFAAYNGWETLTQGLGRLETVSASNKSLPQAPY